MSQFRLAVRCSLCRFVKIFLQYVYEWRLCWANCMDAQAGLEFYLLSRLMFVFPNATSIKAVHYISPTLGKLTLFNKINNKIPFETFYPQRQVTVILVNTIFSNKCYATNSVDPDQPAHAQAGLGFCCSPLWKFCFFHTANFIKTREIALVLIRFMIQHFRFVRSVSA